MLVSGPANLSADLELIRNEAEEKLNNVPAEDNTSLISWEVRLPRHSASCRRSFLRAIENLADQVLKNLKQGCRSETTSDVDAVIDVISVVAADLLRRLARIPGSVLSSYIDWQTNDTQLAFQISTCVVRSSDRLGVSVRIFEPSLNLRLDKPALRLLCEVTEGTLLRTVTEPRAMMRGASDRRAGGIRVEPVVVDDPGFEVHRDDRHLLPSDGVRAPFLRFVKGRLSAKLTPEEHPQAVIVLLFTRRAGA